MLLGRAAYVLPETTALSSNSVLAVLPVFYLVTNLIAMGHAVIVLVIASRINCVSLVVAPLLTY